MNNTIFISDRRTDAAAEAKAIFNSIKDQVGNELVFMDTRILAC